MSKRKRSTTSYKEELSNDSSSDESFNIPSRKGSSKMNRINAQEEEEYSDIQLVSPGSDDEEEEYEKVAKPRVSRNGTNPKNTSSKAKNNSTKSAPKKKSHPTSKPAQKLSKTNSSKKIKLDSIRKPLNAGSEVDLSKVYALKSNYENYVEMDVSALGLADSITEVKALPAKNVVARIEGVILRAIHSILTGKGLDYLIPSRSNTNQMFIPELDRNVLKNDKMTTRSFVSTSMVRKTTITTKILQLVHNILQRGIHITKRDMFYTDVKLFEDQKHSDAVLEDVACMIGCSRTSLNVVASEKGVVVGNLRFTEAGDPIDCSRMGIGGKGIPPILDRVANIESDAEFVLLVEKDAAFIRLSEDRFYQKMRCIIITAKGQPDVATRMFLRRLRDELKIPVLALVDSDPYGLNILSVYMSGSKKMSYDAASLVCPDIKWLGIRPSDLDKYNIPNECRIPMSSNDIERGQELLKEDFIRKNPMWVKELELMLATKEKAEIQALSTFGFRFLTETYLPEKIASGDWV